MKAATLALFTLGAASIRGAWVTATAYAVGDVVGSGGISYLCVTAHTSGTFATDLAAGKWAALGDAATSVAASAVSFSASGNIVATDVQAAIVELDTEKAALAGSSGQVFSVSAATGAAHAVTMRQLQRNSLLHAVAGGTADALTATIASGDTALVDGMRFTIEAANANATTSPTLNLTLGSTATGAKTIKKGSANALLAGDIEGAGMKLDLCWDADNDCWLLLNPAFPVSSSASSIDGLTEDLLPAKTADYVETYDASAAGSKKVMLANLPLPRSYLAGGTLSNNGSDATNDIDVAAGECRDSTNVANIRWAAFTGKQLDVVWAAGSAAGMLSTGTIANTTYFIHAIRKDSDGSADIIADVSASSPTLPAGYTYFRRIGAIIRSGGAIVAFTQDGDDFTRSAPSADVNTAPSSTSAVTRTLSVPVGIRVRAKVLLALSAADVLTGGPAYGYLSDLSTTDTAASSTVAQAAISYPGVVNPSAAPVDVWTNTSAQIRSRLSNSDADLSLAITTVGWTDRRGRDA